MHKIEVYGKDAEKLRAIADKLGITTDEVMEKGVRLLKYYLDMSEGGIEPPSKSL